MRHTASHALGSTGSHRRGTAVIGPSSVQVASRIMTAYEARPLCRSSRCESEDTKEAPSLRGLFSTTQQAPRVGRQPRLDKCYREHALRREKTSKLAIIRHGSKLPFCRPDGVLSVISLLLHLPNCPLISLHGLRINSGGSLKKLKAAVLNCA